MSMMHEQGDGFSDRAGAMDVTDATSRRWFMLMGLGLLATGCAAPATTRRTTSLPGPDWPDKVAEPAHREPELPTRLPEAGPGAGVLSRTAWAKGRPVPSLMKRMLPVRYITVHHDGMTPFWGDTAAAATERLELIRRGHRNQNWGDIGYHYIVDRGGRIWEGRSLAYQGAHVKDHNEGNIGVMCLGNFDEQAPTQAQIAALNRHLGALMRQYGVSMRQVRTHQEWASTACPGRQLQRHMDTVRRGSAIA
jgi:hypothetical protein